MQSSTRLLAPFLEGQEHAGVRSSSIRMCAASHDRSASSSRKRLRRDEVVRSAVSEIAATLDASQDTEYPDTWVRWVGSAETGRASEQMGAIHDDVMAAMRWTRNAFTYMWHPRQAGGRRLLSDLLCVLKAMVWSVKRKRKELCLCVMGMVVSPNLRKAPKLARTGSGGICNACSDSRTTVSMQASEPERMQAGREERSFVPTPHYHYCAIHAVQLAPGTARPGWAARPLIRGSSSLIRRMQSFDTDWQTHPRENKFGLFLVVPQPKSPS